MDKFDSALSDLRDALASTDDIDISLQDIASEHNITAHALRARAVKAWGDLTEKRRKLQRKQLSTDKIDIILRLRGCCEELSDRDLNGKNRNLVIFPVKYWNQKDLLRFQRACKTWNITSSELCKLPPRFSPEYWAEMFTAAENRLQLMRASR